MNIILSVGIAWAVAQLIKILASKKISTFWTPGGMPSAHSAIVGGLATAITIQEGWLSTPAAISYALLVIIAHDAIHERHTFREVVTGILIGIIVVFILSYV
jgi:hypothetical protein